jgi:hypothetical protein
LSLCILKTRCEEESKEQDIKELSRIRECLKDTAEQLDWVCSESEIGEEWTIEKKQLYEADVGLDGFFEQSTEAN